MNFRHEHGRLVAILSRRFGTQEHELCEDAAQAALLRAVETWPRTGEPRDPGAWLYRVAHNFLIDALRRQQRRPALEVPAEAIDAVVLASELPDDLLRMLFLCADPELPSESQLALALKTLCGFSTQEIALRLFQSTEAIHKRLQRARARLRERALDMPPAAELQRRLPQILHMLYLLFNEGYSSAKPDDPIRRELCDEAIRLAYVLAEHPVGSIPETDALLALMHLHASRFDARSDGVVLLREQDRSKWDRSLIEAGVMHLRRSARGDVFSRYHIEAAIAVEHALTPTYEDTPWPEIERLYVALDRVAPSPLNRLNRAIAIAEWQGAHAGLAALAQEEPPPWFVDYYLWDATWAELYRRAGDPTRALPHLLRAIEAAPTHAERALLERRRLELEAGTRVRGGNERGDLGSADDRPGTKRDAVSGHHPRG